MRTGGIVVLGAALVAGCGGGGGTTDGPPITADGAPPPPECRDAGGGAPGDETTPGNATLPSPTTRSITIEWLIAGDADLDATVTVRYRANGADWQQGLPLRRTPAGTLEGFSWPNRFSGSLFDLAPGTPYDVELALSDPDGGCELRTLSATTRAIPAPMPGAPVIAVDPTTFDAAAAAANPGDILELAGGTYPGFTFGRDGAPGMPIVIRAAAGATVDVTGDVRLDGRSHVIVDGLHVTGKFKFNDSLDLAIVRNHVTTTEDGIVTKTRSEDLYIADNVVTGATVWNEAALGVDGINIGEGIEVTGPGHVIERNRVSGFRDCLSLIEDVGGAFDQYSIDIADNDLSECADDGIEADFCFHDCRITGNRLTNVFMAMSSQPGLGGPTYFIRNVAYNVVLSPFKLQRGSIGDVGLHNTIVKSGDAFGIFTTDVFDRQYFRNNLFLGGPGGTYNGYDTGTGRVIELRAAGAAIDLDHDGYGSTTGAFVGYVGATMVNSLAELQQLTTEVHAIEIDAGVFAAPATVPATPFPGQAPPDLRPAGNGAAIDQGVALPGVTTGFAGAAPDLGAYEAGAALPPYGPR